MKKGDEKADRTSDYEEKGQHKNAMKAAKKEVRKQATPRRVMKIYATIEKPSIDYLALARSVPVLQICPGCGVLVEKDGGCDHMVSSWGKRFSWGSVKNMQS